MSEAEVQQRLSGLEREARELSARIEALGAQHGLRVSSPVEASYDESGLLESLAFVGDAGVAFDALQADILGVLAGHIPTNGIASAATIDALSAAFDALSAPGALGARREGAVFANDVESVVVTAKLGMIVDLKLSRHILGSGRPQTICDEVVPVARRAMQETDTLGLYGGAR